jgi:hypothetical protein
MFIVGPRYDLEVPKAHCSQQRLQKNSCYGFGVPVFQFETLPPSSGKSLLSYDA